MLAAYIIQLPFAKHRLLVVEITTITLLYNTKYKEQTQQNLSYLCFNHYFETKLIDYIGDIGVPT